MPDSTSRHADPSGDSPTDDEKFFTVRGRRWRRTDPALAAEVVEQLKSHLGRGRSGVRAGKKAQDTEAVAAARRTVGLAKHGLGERGAPWWELSERDRHARAADALAALEGDEAAAGRVFGGGDRG